MSIETRTKAFTKPDDVIRCVARYFRVTEADIRSTSKKAAISHPRQVGMALAYKRLRKHGYTLMAIGAAFGGRNHATVLFACRKFGIEPDPAHSVRAKRGAAKRARATVPMRPCKPPQPRPLVQPMTRQRTPEEVQRAYWMKQTGFMRAA